MYLHSDQSNKKRTGPTVELVQPHTVGSNTSHEAVRVKKNKVGITHPPVSSHNSYSVLSECNQLTTHPISQPALIKLPSQLNGQSATVLIDSGSSGNFISQSFVNKYNLNTQSIPHSQAVDLADGSRHL